MITTNDVGQYMVRTKDLPGMQELVGQVFLVENVTQEQIVLQLTDDCRPSSRYFKIGKKSKENDDGWHDVTSLIIAANASIQPRHERCVFSCENSCNYRNFLDIIPPPTMVLESEAAGKICLAGTVDERHATFTKVGYYVVDFDDEGYGIVYRGYCAAQRDGETFKHTLQILRLAGTNRKLYLAEPIVTACNKAYADDFAKALEYKEIIDQSILAFRSKDEIAGNVEHTELHRLSLG